VASNVGTPLKHAHLTTPECTIRHYHGYFLLLTLQSQHWQLAPRHAITHPSCATVHMTTSHTSEPTTPPSSAIPRPPAVSLAINSTPAPPSFPPASACSLVKSTPPTPLQASISVILPAAYWTPAVLVPGSAASRLGSTQIQAM